jgi:UDP-N-acetylglucosamine transferase subunit ALG13
MKIFLTVGSMLPFDRLVQAMDAWAQKHAEVKIFAQIGETNLKPLHMEFSAMIDPSDYRRHFSECDIAVSHVGMGTVITAFELNKPVVMMPRRPDLHEVTSNHQLATAQWLDGRPGVNLVYSEKDLADAISKSIGSVGLSQIETGTRKQLISAIRSFIAN